MQLARMHRVAEQNVESLNAAQLKHLVRKPSTQRPHGLDALR